MTQLHNATAKPTTKKNILFGVPEPVPDWIEAQQNWGWAWPIHTYGLGIAFLVVGIYGVFLVVRLLKTPMRRARNYFICISILCSFFGWTRAIVLILDPYSFAKPVHFPPSLGLILLSIGYPCLTSGFFLINWSLVEVTKLQLLPARIHKRKVLAIVLTVHFVVVISFDTSFVFLRTSHTLLLICRSFFVIWGILLFGGFIFGGLRIQRQVNRNMARLTSLGHMGSLARTNQKRATGNQSDDNNGNNVSHGITEAAKHARTGKVMKIARRAAFTGILICITQIYALYEFYVFYYNGIQPNAWPWWVYQTCFRLIELYMVSQMFCIVKVASPHIYRVTYFAKRVSIPPG